MDLRRVFEATIQEHSVVFDIGAHVGFYTLLASTLVGPWPFTPEKSISSVARFFERSIMSSKRLTTAAIEECDELLAWVPRPK